MGDERQRGLRQRRERVAHWMRRWNGGLTRFLKRRVPMRIDAQDLAQEVYLRLLRLEQLDQIARPKAYMYRMARNVAAEWCMRACQSRPHSSDELDTLVDIATPETLLSDGIEEKRIDTALQSLSPMLRAVVYLKLRDDMTHEEIAQHLGITTRMVRRFLSASYAELRRRLLPE